MESDNMFKRIKNEKMLDRNGVFVIIHCDNFDTKYDYMQKVIMSMRWDNQFGFIGGKVDNDESLIQALTREVKEEIGYQMTRKDILNLKHLASYDDNGFGIHSYTLKIDKETMLNIRKEYVNSSYSLEEINGLCIVNIMEDNTNLLNNSFSATAKLELQQFIDDIIIGGRC